MEKLVNIKNKKTGIITRVSKAKALITIRFKKHHLVSNGALRRQQNQKVKNASRTRRLNLAEKLITAHSGHYKKGGARAAYIKAIGYGMFKITTYHPLGRKGIHTTTLTAYGN